MYVKLGKQAGSFYDMKSGLFMVPGRPAEIPDAPSKRVGMALKAGAIVEIKEQEFESMRAEWEKKNPSPEASKEAVVAAPAKTADPKAQQKAVLNKMTEDELLKYYKENYQVDEEDEADFLKLKGKKAKISFLLDEE